MFKIKQYFLFFVWQLLLDFCLFKVGFEDRVILWLKPMQSKRENKQLQKVSDPYFVRLLIQYCVSILYYETVLKGTNY